LRAVLGLEYLRRDRQSAAFNRSLGPLSVKAGLVAGGLGLGWSGSADRSATRSQVGLSRTLH
jgi:hypothetical protein